MPSMPTITTFPTHPATTILSPLAHLLTALTTTTDALATLLDISSTALALLSATTPLAFAAVYNHLLLPLLALSAAGARAGYRRTERFRADCFWHFMVWILNPYAVWLFVFWPGWVVVGAVWGWWWWVWG